MMTQDHSRQTSSDSAAADMLTAEERAQLLMLARQALIESVHGRPIPRPALEELSPLLKQNGATFVTLTHGGELRGCVGALEAYQPLALDVCEHAMAAALNDFRFPPVQPDELPEIEIEISRLTPPQPLDYGDAEDLLNRLQPGVDGVVLRDGFRRATFLPQVWKKIPDPELFLGMLCQKMGVSANTWRRRKLEVLIYRVEEFHE